jgi:hypothetical protein
VKQYKRLIFALPESDYERLANVAAAQCREPEQQAIYYIRRALSRQGAAEPRATERVAAGAS